MNPQIYLKEGDIVELGIDGLGTPKQNIRAYKSLIKSFTTDGNWMRDKN
jgi:hypothetical protein